MTEESRVVVHVTPGMDLCTSAFVKWGVVEAIDDRGADGATVIGRVDDTRQHVCVPAEAIIEIHGACVRLDAPRATIDAQGWEIWSADLR